MLFPSLLTAAFSLCFGILLGFFAGILWRARRKEAAAAEERASLARCEAAAPGERLHAWLSGAAHALSQPLTTLHGTLELALVSKAIPAEAHPVLEDALQQVQSAMSMTRLLRELAEAEVSGQSAQMIPLAPLIVDCREDLEKLAQARGRRLVLRCDVAAPVFAFPADLRRAIQYVAEQALERSSAGGLVQITCAEEDGAACIVIHDDGPAIPAQALEHLFEPFHSSRGGALSKEDALRLAIAERTCASCRGSLTASNEKNGGVRYILRLALPESGKV